MSLSDTFRQLIWIQSLYSELGFKVHGIELNIDNQGAIFLAQNQMTEHRSNILILDIILLDNMLKMAKLNWSIFLPMNKPQIS